MYGYFQSPAGDPFTEQNKAKDAKRGMASTAVFVTPGMCAISRSNMSMYASHRRLRGERFCAEMLAPVRLLQGGAERIRAGFNV